MDALTLKIVIFGMLVQVLAIFLVHKWILHIFKKRLELAQRVEWIEFRVKGPDHD